MKEERIKELMAQVGMPDSQSLMVALQQVANETEQEVRASYHQENEDMQESPPSKMKLCKDCEFCEPSVSGIPCLSIVFWEDYDIAECYHPKATTKRIDYVTGKPLKDRHFSCVMHRALGCGPEGKYWEER